MNEKEVKSLKHYKYIIENRKFDEYDIMGFLMLIREHLNKKKNPIIYDIADGTAHRNRNKGELYDSMYNAALNNYLVNDDNHVEGYNGILENKWKQECLNLTKQFNIKITPIISIELAVCMFSIIHRSKFETNRKSFNKDINIKCSIEMVTDEDSLAILTSDDIKNITVCFMKIENIEIIKKNEFIWNPVETYRKNGFLFLRSDDADILRVAKRK